MTVRRLVIAYAMLAALLGAIFVVALLTGPYRAIQRSDYMTYQVAARIVLNGNGDCLYTQECQAAAQRELIGEEPTFEGGALPFNSPPVLAAVVTPLGTLPLTAGFLIFTTIATAVLGAAAWRLAWGGTGTRLLATVFVLSAWPTALAVVRGQSSLLVVGLLGLSAATRGYPRGVALGLAILKPTLAPLWGIWQLASGQWRAAVIAFLVAVGLTVVGILVVGAQATSDYPQYLAGVASPGAVGVHVDQMVNWRGTAARLGLGEWLVVAGTLLTLAAVVVAWWRTPARRLAAATAFIATPLVIPHANQHESMLAILGLLIAISATPRLRVPLVAAALAMHAALWLGPVLDASTNGTQSGALIFGLELAALAVVFSLSLERRPTP